MWGASSSPAAAIPASRPVFALPSPTLTAMLERDAAARALGIELVETGAGSATVRMTVRPDMLNGHGTCHGGMMFMLADTAFAIACNSHGDPAVASAAAIEFIAPAHAGATLTATAREQIRQGRNGVYDIEVRTDDGTVVALFRGRSRTIGGTVR
jgi:acyl-CoA thioesterase